MKGKMYGHYWLGRGEILGLLQVRQVVHSKVRSSPKVRGPSHLRAVFLWQVVSLGSRPFRSVFCIVDLPNFSHLIAVIFRVVEAYEDSVDIFCVFLHQLALFCYASMKALLAQAGRLEGVRPNMGR